MNPQWENLVSESQFATELAVTGLRRLCTVEVGAWGAGTSISYDQSYPLHAGLLSFTSGLERLCKLTIACHGYLTSGTFPPLKGYGHRISRLLNSVGRLDLSTIEAAADHPPAQPDSELDPELTELLDRYANGAGRYEHLDSLSSVDAVVGTHQTWSALASRSTVSGHVKEMLAIRSATVAAIREVCTEGDIESAAYSLLDSIDDRLNEASIGVALEMYRKASWAAAYLNFLTYYTRRDLPILGEAVQDLGPSADEFFQYAVATVEDEHIAAEELQAYFQRRPEPSEDDDF